MEGQVDINVLSSYMFLTVRTQTLLKAAVWQVSCWWSSNRSVAAFPAVKRLWPHGESLRC